MQYVINLYTSLIVKVLYVSSCKHTKNSTYNINIILTKVTQNADKNIVCKLVKYYKSLYKLLTLYYISMIHILKNRHKTDISNS